MSGVGGFRVINVRVVQSKVEAPDPFFLDEAVKPQRIDMSVIYAKKGSSVKI